MFRFYRRPQLISMPRLFANHLALVLSRVHAMGGSVAEFPGLIGEAAEASMVAAEVDGVPYDEFN